MRRSALARVAAVGLAAGCLVACSSVGLRLDELPPQPIAVTYWEGEDARRRAEQLRADEAAPRKVGVADVDSLRRFVGADVQRAARYPGRLSLIDPRTLEVTPIVQAPRGALALAWSADRRRLLFLSNHRDGIQVYEYDRERREVRPVTAGERPHLYADYGLGDQIALLQLDLTGARAVERVLVTDGPGRVPRIVLEDRNVQTVRLSPDGRTLVYVRRPPPTRGREAGPTGLVSVDLATGEEQELGPGRDPAFSPTGDWIVYSAPSRDGWRLRRMRPDGSARSPVAAGIRDEKMPSVSPDGRFVVYVREATGLEQLFVRRMDGSGDRVLLDRGAVFAPVW